MFYRYGKDLSVLNSTNKGKVTVSFDMLNNTNLFHQIHGVYIEHKLLNISWIWMVLILCSNLQG